MEFCHKVIPTRSQYADVAEHKCHCPKGHSGKCEEFPFLNHLKSINKQVAEKIKRDATMTTGAAWKSADTGPNRILNTPPETVPLDRTNGAAKPLKWCMVTAAMVH